MTRLDDMIDRFRRIPGARVGHGPRHPVQPNPSSAQRQREFLDTYWAVSSDAGYFEFLEKYAGASIRNDAATQIVDLLGFSDASPDIVELDGPVVDDDGFLIIAQATYHVDEAGREVDAVQHDIALDATGQRKPGIYHSFASRERPVPRFAWQHFDFTSWLDELVVFGGWLSPPGPPRLTRSLTYRSAARYER